MRSDHPNRFISDHAADRRVANSEMHGKFLEGQKLGAHRIDPPKEEAYNAATVRMGMNVGKGIISNLDRVARYRLIVEEGGGKLSNLGSVKSDQAVIDLGEVRFRLAALMSA